MHGGFSDDDDKPKRDRVDTSSIREKVKLARSEKWRILKNITAVSFAFMVQFTAFQVSDSSFLILQTKPVKTNSIHREQQIFSHRSTQKTHSEQFHWVRYMERLSSRVFSCRLWLFVNSRQNGRYSSAWCVTRLTLQLSSIHAFIPSFR